jgi:hypothetical protein
MEDGWNLLIIISNGGLQAEYGGCRFLGIAGIFVQVHMASTQKTNINTFTAVRT